MTNCYTPKRILHVAESFGGGVGNAILDYVDSTPEFEHHLLYAERNEAPITARALEPFTSTTLMRTGHLSRTRDVDLTSARIGADIIHAHSSFGGGYARLSRSSRSIPIIYTPHCYAFERRDVSAIGRYAFRLAERVLAGRTSVFAVCSIREGDLSRALSRRPIVFIPNTPPRDISRPERRHRAPQLLHIVGAGRDAPQKDPDFFRRSIRALRDRGFAVSATWVGGSADLRDEWAPDAIRVTGWLPREQALYELAQADLYLHTAAWEGFPVAILEAIALRVPTLARAIPAYAGLSIPQVHSAHDFVDVVAGLEATVGLDKLLSLGSAALAANTSQHQRDALLRTYTSAATAHEH